MEKLTQFWLTAGTKPKTSWAFSFPTQWRLVSASFATPTFMPQAQVMCVQFSERHSALPKSLKFSIKFVLSAMCSRPFDACALWNFTTIPWCSRWEIIKKIIYMCVCNLTPIQYFSLSLCLYVCARVCVWKLLYIFYRNARWRRVLHFFFKAEFLYAAFLTELIVTPQARQQLAACDVASLACQLRFIVSFSPYCACFFFLILFCSHETFS